MRARYIYYIKERIQVVTVVHHGLLHGLPHRLESGKMDDGVYLVGFKKSFHCSAVAEINFMERYLGSCDLAGAKQTGLVTIGHIVGYYNLVTGLYEFYRDVTAYESCAA